MIVNCKSAEDKKLIMDNKSKLKDNHEYNKVQIFHNKTPAQLQLEASLRTIVYVVGGDKLQMRGSQVVRKIYDPSQVKLEVGAQERGEVVLAGAEDVEEVVKHSHIR